MAELLKILGGSVLMYWHTSWTTPPGNNRQNRLTRKDNQMCDIQFQALLNGAKSVSFGNLPALSMPQLGRILDHPPAVGPGRDHLCWALLCWSHGCQSEDFLLCCVMFWCSASGTQKILKCFIFINSYTTEMSLIHLIWWNQFWHCWNEPLYLIYESLTTGFQL